MSDLMDDSIYIEELRNRITSLKSLLADQRRITTEKEQQLAQAREQTEQVQENVEFYQRKLAASERDLDQARAAAAMQSKYREMAENQYKIEYEQLGQARALLKAILNSTRLDSPNHDALWEEARAFLGKEA